MYSLSRVASHLQRGVAEQNESRLNDVGRVRGVVVRVVRAIVTFQEGQVRHQS